MASEYEDRVVALAGMTQAAQLVAQTAHSGMISQGSFQAALTSLFAFDPGSAVEVFGGLEKIRPGLRLLQALLGGSNLREHDEVIRYVLAMMAMERNLAREPEIFRLLGEELRNIAAPGDELGDNEIHRIALLYEHTIGKLEPRIRVMGNRHHLQNERNVERIRALLLAGIRAAVLWRQVGGRRWHLFLARGQLRRALAGLTK